MYAGYLTFGENVVLNNELSRGYASSRNCPMTWYQAPFCSTLNEALDEDLPYGMWSPTDVPWYDAKLADLSARFLGVYGIDFSLALDSTRQVPTVEGITDGGVIGRTRKGMKRLRLRALLVGEGLDALNYGMSWLNAVIDPDACGQVSSKCGTADLGWLADCPPERATTPTLTGWSTLETNLATNPSFEATSGTVEVRRNLATNPIMGTVTESWRANPGTGGSATGARVTGLSSQFGVDTGFRVTWSAASTAVHGGLYYQSTPVTAGVTYTATMSFSPSITQNLHLRMEWKDAGGGIVSSISAPPEVVQAGEVRTQTVSGVAPALAATVVVTLYALPPGVVWPVGATLTATKVMIEASPTAQPYFDGANRPRLRENFTQNPALRTGTATWGTSGAATRQAVAGPLGKPGWQLARVASAVVLASPDASPTARMAVVPGESLTFSATGVVPAGGQMQMDLAWRGPAGENLGTSQRTRLYAAGSTPPAAPNQVAEPDVPTRFSHTVVVPAGVVAASIRIFLDAGPADFTTYATDFLLERGTVLGEYFDGSTAPNPGFGHAWSGTANASTSYVYDADLTPTWTGTANASASVLNGVGVATVTAGFPERAARIQSSRWVKSGTKSLRVIPQPSGGTNTYAEIGFATNIGQTYTVLGTIHLEAPQSGFPGTLARTIVGGGGGTALSPAAPNEAGDHDLRGTFVATAATTYLRFFNGASHGNGDVWWDDILVVEGTYGGPYFDGNTPGDPASTPLWQYAWTGAANASTSVEQWRTWVDVPEDDASYFARVDDLYRFLRTCAAESGAIITAEFRSGNFFGYEVEVDFVSETPHILGVTHTIPLDPASPSVVQDIVYNLVQTPSAEAVSIVPTEVVVQTNYSTNPSLETNATGWVAAQTTITGTLSGARSNPATDPAAVGQYSYKVGITATNTSTNGILKGYQDVTLPAYVAGQRFSFSMWGFMAVGSGTAVLNNMRFILEWRDGSNAVVGSAITVGTGSVSGGAIAGPNLVRPATAVTARCIMEGHITSWSSGAVLNMFVDALVVSLP